MRKLKFRLTSWNSTINLPIPYENVSAIKVRWLLYTTATTGNEDLSLSCKEFNASGYNINRDGSNDDYFFTTPLDLQSNVTCLTSNFTGEMDISFENVIRSINKFTLEVYINGIPAIDISNSNPLVIELGFY
jgi:hypothetical protein